jgi:hypothetical protein
MQTRVKKLWNIQAKDQSGLSLPEGNLLVLARNPGHAVEKAEKYLRKNYWNFKIKRVEFEGEIDIF